RLLPAIDPGRFAGAGACVPRATYAAHRYQGGVLRILHRAAHGRECADADSRRLRAHALQRRCGSRSTHQGRSRRDGALYSSREERTGHLPVYRQAEPAARGLGQGVLTEPLRSGCASPSRPDMSPHTRALLQIHLCVMLWGFTAILGKLITLSALPIVWWRMILVAGALLLVPRFWSGLRVLPLRLVTIYAAIGVLVSLHWLTFYGSIKLANASVTATCMALVPVFVAFVEPVVAKRRFDPAEVIFGIAVVPGVAMVVGGTPSGMRLGIAVGALSAFLAAIFASLNKRFIGNSQALTVIGIEMGAGAVF